ncbi:MAG: mannosyltransferase [Candidatus Sumerlaeota bacterium]|nr:mannosyltransferase [Candidatus Sumerlaeota bacterium]
MNTTHSQSEQEHSRRPAAGPPGWAVVLGVAVLAAAARLPTLGSDSLWMDEILNWGVAREFGVAWPGGSSSHPLTLLTQALAVHLGDGPFWVRLPSALFGIAAAVVAAAWGVRRLGSVTGAVTGTLLAMAPFAIYYSQDANHYAPLLLAGVLASVSVDWFLAGRERPAWGRFALAAGTTALAVGFHPLGALPVGALAATTAAWMLTNVERLPLPVKATDKRQLLLVLVFGGGLAAAAPFLWDRLARASGITGREDMPFAWTWEFWHRTLGNFLGGTYHALPGSGVLGITGAVLAIAGCVLLAGRRPWKQRGPAPWAAAGAIMVFVACVLPFTVQRFGHYFSPRFIAPVASALFLGIGVALGGCFERLPRGRGVAAVAAVWLAGFLAVSGVWQIERSRTEHQATGPAIEWLRTQTPPDARVFTRLYYTSRATRFLWRASEMGGRTHEAVSFVRFDPASSIQQMEEALASDERPSYFLTLSDYELQQASLLKTWLDANGEAVAVFESGTPDEHWPIDRTIRIWKLRAPARNPLALPRDGAAASALLGEERIRRSASPWLALYTGTGGVWNFETPRELDGLALQVRVPPPLEGAGRRWLLALLDGEAAFLWEVPKTARDEIFDIRLDAPLSPGPHRLDATALRHGGTREGGRTFPFQMGVLSEPVGGEERVTPLRPLASSMDAGSWEVGILPGTAGLINEATVEIDPAQQAEVGEWVVATRRLSNGGLGNRELWMRAEGEHGRVMMTGAIEWTHGWVTAAGILPAADAGSAVNVTLELRPIYGRRPYAPELGWEAPRLWGVAPQ